MSLSLWFTGIETMADLKEFVNRVLLPVQLSLGLFQIMKTTPLWAVIHCALASLLNFFNFPYTDYKQLGGFKGPVLKKVISYTTTAGTKVKMDTGKTKKEGKSEEKKKDPEEYQKEGESVELEKATKEGKSEDLVKTKNEGKSKDVTSANVKYLGKKFELKRKEGNKMLVKDGPTYYITDKMWETVLHIEKVVKDQKSVFVKDHKEIWEEVVTGDIMEFEEVLDSVILDNRAVVRLDHDYFLPVNLLMSEIKLTTTLNFVGLFLKTQNHIHWLIPALLTFTSVIMGFSTTLRLWIDRLIYTIFCRSVQFLCDRLPLAMRRWAYSWGNFKPSNDLKSKIVRGTTILLVAAGAKLDSESFADCESLDGSVLVDGGAKAHLETTIDCESLVDQSNQHYFLTQGPKAQSEEIWPKTGRVLFKCDRIRVLVDGGAKALLESLAEPVITTDKSNKLVLLAKGTNAQLQPSVDSEHEISAKVGPFLFKCESKCDLKWNSNRYSVYIEWIFDIQNQICSLKAGRLASQLESLKSHDVSIITDHHDIHCSQANDKIPAFRLASLYGKSLVADDLDTSSVDVECNSEEAIKLLKFAFHMAKYKTTSLKSYDRKTKKVTVRRFVESINAYVSSSYPPLYRLIMDDVVVR